MYNSIAGRTALITGGAGLLGVAHAKALLAIEANVILTDVNKSELVKAQIILVKRYPKAKILILGIAYKKNVDDTRESPGIELIKLFLEKGATVHYSDPFIPVFPKMRKYSYNMLSVKISQKKIASYDAIVLSTNHDKFNYPMIQRNAKLIIDTRGVFKNKTFNLVSA